MDNSTLDKEIYVKTLENKFEFLHKTIDTLDLPFIRLSYPDFIIADINQKALNIIEG